MKLGRIRISEQMFKEDQISYLYPVMAEFIPLHIEHRLNHNEREYTGISEDFEDLKDAKEGIDIPLYVAVITTGKQGKIIEVKFNKV